LGFFGFGGNARFTAARISAGSSRGMQQQRRGRKCHTLGLAFMTSFSQICRGEACECVPQGFKLRSTTSGKQEFPFASLLMSFSAFYILSSFAPLDFLEEKKFPRQRSM